MNLLDNRHHADYQARMAMFQRFAAQCPEPPADDAAAPRAVPAFLERWPLPAYTGRRHFASRPR